MKILLWGAVSLTAMTSALAKPIQTEEVNTMLEKIRAEHDLPALGGIAIVDGDMKVVGAVGLRKFKGKKKVTIDDKWHIGSCTKSMTATLAATFVEEGRLKWDSTIGEVLGRKVKMRDEYKNVSLKTLVSNRSGIPGEPPTVAWVKAVMNSGKRDIKKRRRKFAEELLKMKPEFEPGTNYAYSNSGFVVAGAMLEAVAGKSWEELMRERIFKPLKMNSAGFGGAASKRKEDQPWGHKSKTKPQRPGPGDDNPDVVGPAGTVHCSLPDLARYVKMHMTHEIGLVLKNPETFVFLQTVAKGNDDYACGWVVMERLWAKGPALYHNGSNTMNYCVIWMAPKRKFAAIAVSNVGSESASKACDSVAVNFIDTFLAENEEKPHAKKRGGAWRKVSPFSGVRWKGEVPIVKVKGKWFKLVSLDKIDVEKIVEFSKRTYNDKWKKRFAEDLVEVLAGMGHEARDSTELVVQSLDSKSIKTLKRVAMTEDNRKAIRNTRDESQE